MTRSTVPSELSEQIAVVRALRRSGSRFAAIPNGGLRTRQGAIALKNSGVQAGVPDILIFDIPTDWSCLSRSCGNAYSKYVRGCASADTPLFTYPALEFEERRTRGCALEMKRSNGKPSDVSAEQRKWLQALSDLGWFTVVGYGANDALRKLLQLGYRIKGGLA